MHQHQEVVTSKFASLSPQAHYFVVVNMKNKFLAIAAALLIATLSACGNDPGPLAGTWKMNGPIPMTVQFRSGETEAMGMIEKVSYEVKGNDVIVTYKDGLAKGTAMRYTVVGNNTLRTELGSLQRIK